MAIITDVSKLRPDLLDKSDAELERLAAEIAMAQAERKRQAEIKAKQELAADANRRIDEVVEGVKWLHANGMLPEKVAAGFTGGNGAFMPATFLRNVSAESLAGVRTPRDPSRPKRHRRTRAEIEAARAAGEPVRRPRK